MSGGYVMNIRPRSDPWERDLYWRRSYEPATLALIDEFLRPGDHFIDVGANIGLMSLHAARAVGPSGTVTSFEPHPVTFQRLVTNVNLNGHANIRLYNLALGAADGKLELYDVPTINQGRSSLILSMEESISAGIVTVKRLDDLVEPTRRRAILKIDVEGFEYQVLLGAPDILMSEPLICMECDPELPSFGDDGPTAALEMIAATKKYEIFRFKNSKFGPSPRLIPASLSEWRSLRYENAICVPRTLVTCH
jgi:FkbM family methyltransferase